MAAVAGLRGVKRDLAVKRGVFVNIVGVPVIQIARSILMCTRDILLFDVRTMGSICLQQWLAQSVIVMPISHTLHTQYSK